MIGPCMQCKRDLTRCTLIYTIQGADDMEDGSYCEPCYTHFKRGTDRKIFELRRRMGVVEERLKELERER